MIHNSLINLKPESSVRKDAFGSLKYTLFLNTELPDIENDKSAVQILLNECKRNCSKLFAFDTSKIYLPFFGITAGAKPNLSYLDMPDDNDKKPSFIDMILQHCLISAYHAIVTDLLQNYSETSYYVSNHLPLSINDINGPAETEQSNANNEVVENSIKSQKATILTKATSTHLKHLKSTSNLFVSYTKKENTLSSANTDPYRYSVQFAKLWKAICEVPAPDWRFDYSSAKTYKRKKILENLVAIPKRFEEGIPAASRPLFADPMDKIYYKYIWERIFGFDLINCIFQNVFDVSKSNPDGFLFDTNIIEKTICKSKLLPNTFSRIYFLQYAFEKIKYHPESYHDYWFNQFNAENRPDYIPSFYSTNGIPSGFFMDKWSEQFAQFCTYMAKFVIPVHEWYFLNMLLTYVENKNQNADHKSHLCHAKKLLSDYILKKENLERIRDCFNGNQELSLIRPGKDLSIDIPEPYKIRIIENILPHDDTDIDLNLPLINPDFFLGADRKTRFLPYSEEYRKFNMYIIKRQYLDEGR